MRQGPGVAPWLTEERESDLRRDPGLGLTVVREPGLGCELSVELEPGAELGSGVAPEVMPETGAAVARGPQFGAEMGEGSVLRVGLCAGKSAQAWLVLRNSGLRC